MTVPILYQVQTYGALVWSKTIDTAVTSVTTDGEVLLDCNAHGGYEFEFCFVENGASDYNLYYNNDQDSGNYYRTFLYGSNTISPTTGYAGDARIALAQGNAVLHIVNGHIGRHPSGMPITSAQQGSSSTTLIALTTHRYVTTVSNITRIDIVALVANGIGVNSRFRLWRRM